MATAFWWRQNVKTATIWAFGTGESTLGVQNSAAALHNVCHAMHSHLLSKLTNQSVSSNDLLPNKLLTLCPVIWSDTLAHLNQCAHESCGPSTSQFIHQSHHVKQSFSFLETRQCNMTWMQARICFMHSSSFMVPLRQMSPGLVSVADLPSSAMYGGVTVVLS